MDNFDISDKTGVSHKSLPCGSYAQPHQSATIRRQQATQEILNLALYNSIEDWSATELTTDSAPSPGSVSPVSPIFTGLASSFITADDWTSWDKLEQSPGTDLFLKSELLDSPELASISVMSPALNSMDVSNPALDDVVQFGSEGVNDTRPLFQSPQVNINMPPRQQAPAEAEAPDTIGLLTPPVPSQASKQRNYPARASLKRKSSSEDRCSPSSSRSSCSPPPPQRRHTTPPTKEGSPFTATSKSAMGPKKTAHNMIEKRYRTNLNDKIAALRDSVPALRVMVQRLEHADDEAGDATNIIDEIKAEAGMDFDDDLCCGVTPAHKLNKATILSKATEYIAHLERKNQALAKENSALRNRVEGFELLVLSSRNGQTQLERPMWQ